MNKTTIGNQYLFDLHLEYSQGATVHEKEYRELEGKFALAFGYLPIQIGDEMFPYLTDNQQHACEAFWKNLRVVNAKRNMVTARSLAEAYFNAFSDFKNEKA